MEKRHLGDLKDFLLLSGPTLFVFITVIAAPFVYGIYLTFTNWDGISAQHIFIGLKNYTAVMHDQAFWASLLLTVKYVAATVVLTNVLAFTLAYALTSGIKGQNFFRAGFFTPNLIGGIVLGLVWNFIFSNVLVYLGQHLHVSWLAVSWLGSPVKAFWAMVLVTVWQYSGYMMLIYIAGLMNIPRDVLEAANIDGANAWVKLRSITLPLMVPSFVVCVFLTLQRGFMVYDVNLSLTAGGPFKSTQLISMQVFEKAFLAQEYGIGQAEAIFLFLLVAAVTLLQVYFGKKLEVEA